MRRIQLLIISFFIVCILASCGVAGSPTTGNDGLKDGLSAIEDAMGAGTGKATGKATGKNMDDLREGTSEDTVATPEDFPEVYDYGSGKISDYDRSAMLKKMPKPKGNETVLNTAADPENIQVLYLWEKDNVPAETTFTEDMTGYFDNWDFRPYVTAIPVKDGVTPKGAVVLMAGGAYQFRGNYTDALPTAAALREYGYQTFIVDYRLEPYSQEEGALDVARAVRFVRKNADIYGIDPDDIAVMGFSAGGIQAGEFLMHYDEMVNGTALDKNYVPDELDQIPAHASADGMIYSFYGRLSVGNMDEDWLREGDLPPTFYVYGTEDPFYNQFQQQYQVLQDMGIQTERIVLDGWPHGFGSDGGWVKDYADWLEKIFHGETTSSTANVTAGSEYYKGFLLDNVLHSEKEGDIHYNVYIPDDYDGSEPYALFMTLPGYQGLYFQGVGENIRTENVGFTAQEYNPKMIIVAPQLNDWGETSARQTIALTEYFLSAYNIDQSKVYAEGYSGGGETMSLVMGMKPELYTAYLQGSSQWDGDCEAVVKKRTPVYLVVGENDEYYGSEPSREAYRKLHGLYEKEGLSDEEIDKFLVLDVKDSSYFRNANVTNQHGQGGRLFFRDKMIMGWLFGQQKDS